MQFGGEGLIIFVGEWVGVGWGGGEGGRWALKEKAVIN